MRDFLIIHTSWLPKTSNQAKRMWRQVRWILHFFYSRQPSVGGLTGMHCRQTLTAIYPQMGLAGPVPASRPSVYTTAPWNWLPSSNLSINTRSLIVHHHYHDDDHHLLLLSSSFSLSLFCFLTHFIHTVDISDTRRSTALKQNIESQLYKQEYSEQVSQFKCGLSVDAQIQDTETTGGNLPYLKI